MRITLIHALTHSIAPTANAFSRLWPEATLMNLLDDSLSVDLARDGALTPAMTERFLALARYAASTGAQGILFTCSAFGPCIEACARELAPMPVLKPNEAMIEDAVALAGPTGRIGLLATFPPTLQSMPPEFHHAGGAGISVEPCLAEGALAVLLCHHIPQIEQREVAVDTEVSQQGVRTDVGEVRRGGRQDRD